MDKAQAIHSFWSGFGLTAYDENTVDEDAVTPYITYSVSTDNLDEPITLNGSLWYRSNSWEEISQKIEEISSAIYRMRPIKIDDGYLWITKGNPFAQRMSEPGDDMMRRIYINLIVEFLTAY